MHVNPGTVVVEATPTVNNTGDVTVANPSAYYVLNDNPALTGNDITNPAQSTDPNTGQPNVTFGFTGHGKTSSSRSPRRSPSAAQLAQVPGVSKPQAEQHFAIVLDNQLISVPSIDYTQYPTGIDATNGSEISGGFTLDSAQNLANELQSGALPIRLSLVSLSQVSATLGKQALNQGLIAGLIGFLAVCLFLLVFYRVLGVIAIGGLIIYGVYFFALIKLIPVTLTLAGIAGLILTIGVAADANIVIFERVKEEIRGGRSIAAGIATGYKRGFAAIVDANVVTIMVAFILFVLSSADVKGFALTLGMGTIVSLFTAVLATQAALGIMSRSRFISSPAHGRRRQAAACVDVRLHGSLEVVLLAVGHDPAHRRAGHRRQGHQLRHRLQVRHPHPDGARAAGHAGPGGQRRGQVRIPDGRGAGVQRAGPRQQRVPDLDPVADAGQGRQGAVRARRRASAWWPASSATPRSVRRSARTIARCGASSRSSRRCW